MLIENKILLAAILFVVILILYKRSSGESFISKKEKAKDIYTWINKLETEDKSPSYVDFRASIDDTDIVDYHKVKKAIEGGNNISIDVIENLI